MAAPTLVNSTTTQASVAAGGSLALTLPTGGQLGDSVLVIAAANGTDSSVTMTGSWTQVAPASLSGSLYMRAWAISWSAGLPIQITSGAPSSRWLTGTAVLIRGGAPVASWTLGAVWDRQTYATATTAVAPGVAVTAEESLVVSLFAEQTAQSEADIVSVSGATKYLFVPQHASTTESLTIAQSVQNTTTVTEERRNRHVNPRVGVDTNGWSAWLSGGAYSSSRQTSGGPAGIADTWWRGVVTTAPTGSPAIVHTRGSGVNSVPVTASTAYTFSAYAIASRVPSSGVRIDIQWLTSSGASISTVSSTNAAMTASTWQRVSHTATAPANAAFARPSVSFSGPQGVWVTNDTFGATAVLIEQSAVLAAYFDGDQPDGGGYEAAWAGTAHASESILSSSGTATDVIVTYPNSGNGQEVRRNRHTNPRVGTATTDWAINPAGASTTTSRQTTGGPSVSSTWYRLSFTSSPTSSPAAIHTCAGGTSGLPVTASTSYTASVYVYSTKATITGVRVDMTWYNSAGTTLSTSGGTTTAIAASTWERRSVTATAPSTAAYVRVSATFSGPNGVVVSGDYFGATGVLLEQSASLGSYFDGAYTSDAGVTPSWLGTADASVSILSSVGAALAQQLAIPPGPAINPGYPVQVKTAGGVVEKRVYRQTAQGPVTPQQLVPVPRGYDTVADMLTREPFYVADRGGALNWPEGSLYAYTQSIVYKAGALELPVNRTSDGVWFVLLDTTLDRTSGITGSIDPTALTWAQVQAYTIAEPAGFTGGVKPYMRLDEIAALYGKTHIFFLDPRFRDATHRTEFLDTITSLFPPNRIVVKHYYTFTALAAAAKARGLATYGYYTQAAIDADANAIASTHADWDILGLNWDATATTWSLLQSFGKPTVAHSCDTEEKGEIGLGLGADGLMMREVVNTIQARTPILPSPARVYAKHPFASTSFWNMPLHSGVTYSSVGDVRVTGTKGIRTLNGTINYQADWNLAIWQAAVNSPLVEIKAPRYSYPTWPAAGITHRVPASGVVPGPDGDGSYNVEYDGWVTIVDPEGKLAIDLYKAKWLTPGVTLQAAYAYQYPLDSVGGSDATVGTPAGDGLKASNWPYMGGTLRVWEMNDSGTSAASRIKHALSLSIPRNNLKAGYIWPARGEDYGSTSTDPNLQYKGDIRMGTCFALPPSYDIENAGLTDHGKALAYALKNYGAWVGDASSSATLYMEMNTPSNLGIAYNDAWDVLRYELVAVDGRSAANPGGTGTPVVPLTPEGIFGPVS